MHFRHVTSFERFASLFEAINARIAAAKRRRKVEYWARHYTRLWCLCWRAEQ